MNLYQPLSTNYMSNKLTSDADRKIRAITPLTQSDPQQPQQSSPLSTYSMPPTQQSGGGVLPQPATNASSGITPNIGGMSLKMPASLGMQDYTEYKKGNLDKQFYSTPPYDVQPNSQQFMAALMEDEKNLLIGALPAIGQGQNARLKTAGSDGGGGGQFSSFMKQVGVQGVSEVGKMVGDTISAVQNTRFNDYQDDLTYWLSQGKFWFDPKAELKPDLEAYLAQMPNAVDAVGGGKAFGLNIGGGMASGAAAGFASGGPIGAAAGAVVGGLTGLVKSIFTHRAAKDQDKKNKERARQQYEKELKEWTINRNKRIIAQNELDAAKRNQALEAKIAKDEAAEAATKIKKELSAIERRDLIKSAILTAGNAGREYRQRRLNRQAA